MKVEIVTPMGKIFSGSVKSITLPGSAGEFGVLPGHSPIVSTLNPGIVDIVEENGSEAVIAINWGYVDVKNDAVNVLVDDAVIAKGNTDENVAHNIEKAKELLREFAEANHILAHAEAKLERIAK